MPLTTKADKHIKIILIKMMDFFKKIGIGYKFIPFVLLCIIFCILRDEYMQVLHNLQTYCIVLLRNMTNPQSTYAFNIGNDNTDSLFEILFIHHPSINLILLALLVYIIICANKELKKFHPYLCAIYIIFIIEIVRNIIDIFVSSQKICWICLVWNILFFIFFFILAYFEIKNAKQTIKMYNLETNIQDKISTGFRTRTDKKDIIDVGYGNYSNVLLSLMSATDISDESFAISIVGSWGSGKSTFLQALIKAMDKRFVVIEFTPWYSQTPESLVHDFFNCLREELGKKKIEINFSRYLDALQEVDSTGMTKAINQLTKSNKTIENEKDEIEKYLALMHRKVVIMIDDTDRMGKDEIMELFKIIRLTANFKNVFFIVTYDKDYIVQQMRYAKISKPTEYLKKIFPVEISLPYIENNVLTNMFEQEMRRYHFDEKFIPKIIEQLQIKCSDNGNFLISEYVRNFRDVKNFLNALLVSYHLIENSSIKNEYSPVDFFWMEVIHSFIPEVYNVLSNEPQLLLKYDTDDSIGSDDDRMYVYRGAIPDDGNAPNGNNRNRELRKVIGKNEVQILNILFDTNNKSDYSIKSRNNFYKYFEYNLPTNILSKAEFNYFLERKNKEELEDLLKEYQQSGKIKSLFDYLLTFELKTYQDKIRANNFIYAIIEMPEYVDYTETLKYLFKNNLAANVCSLINKDDVDEHIMRIIKSGKCAFLTWNKLLASIYCEKIIESNGVYKEYKSIFENKEIENLATMNFNNYLESHPDGLPIISDITTEGKELNKFVYDAHVSYCHDNSYSLNKQINLVYNSLLEHYKTQRDINEKYIHAFFAPLKIEIYKIDRTIKFYELDKNVLSKLEFLFVERTMFKNFVTQCFKTKVNII